MEEGVNSGRTSPWNKEYLISLYNKIDKYCKDATLHALRTEGLQAAGETLAAYSMFKNPVIYIITHYHFGSFENLGMSDSDIKSYLMFLPMVKYFTKSMMEGMMEQQIFSFDKNNEIAPALIDICKEVLFIEGNC